MKTIKDLTPEQAVEITRNSSIEKFIIEEKGFNAFYQPLIPEHYEDALECYKIYFYSYTFADTVDKMLCIIYTNLDVSVGYLRQNEHGVWCETGLPLRNQHSVQKKFMEWGINPK